MPKRMVAVMEVEKGRGIDNAKLFAEGEEREEGRAFEERDPRGRKRPGRRAGPIARCAGETAAMRGEWQRVTGNGE